jgi:hypothetical protein
MYPLIKSLLGDLGCIGIMQAEELKKQIQFCVVPYQELCKRYFHTTL